MGLFLPQDGVPMEQCLTNQIAHFYNKECNVVMRTSAAHLVINAFHLAVALGE